MGEHVHFDLDAAAKTLRTGMKASADEAMKLAPDADGRELVRLQHGLDEFSIAATLWQLQCLNEQANPDIAAQALGFIIGNVIASFAGQYEEPSEMIDQILASAEDSISQNFEGADHGTVLAAVIPVHSIEGGRA